mmetsp:Transcript_16600/g.40889  ORF Transcript_16600/g.40889 Transcript_16600/m.40889 type:complete len:148 (+) Transcript_16600:169-612(+)
MPMKKRKTPMPFKVPIVLNPLADRPELERIPTPIPQDALKIIWSPKSPKRMNKCGKISRIKLERTPTPIPNLMLDYQANKNPSIPVPRQGLYERITCIRTSGPKVGALRSAKPAYRIQTVLEGASDLSEKQEQEKYSEFCELVNISL